MTRTAIAALAFIVSATLAHSQQAAPATPVATPAPVVPAAPVDPGTGTPDDPDAPATVPFAWITMPPGERAHVIEQMPHDDACPHGFSHNGARCVVAIEFIKVPYTIACKQTKAADATGLQLIVCSYRLDGKPEAAATTTK